MTDNDPKRCTENSHYFVTVDRGCECGAIVDDCGVLKHKPQPAAMTDNDPALADLVCWTHGEKRPCPKCEPQPARSAKTIDVETSSKDGKTHVTRVHLFEPTAREGLTAEQRKLLDESVAPGWHPQHTATRQPDLYLAAVIAALAEIDALKAEIKKLDEHLRQRHNCDFASRLPDLEPL